ncbi:hypothetical protein PYW08_012329 [Mythimna loreyi]|uniref:Uncharacterized protein n=1 Tax=Mythimna loreyi TaxID=667449 RepID=A0ACC2Q0D4_9NEOP|nr:hypothetical protein PYW08_012329 [Mythimna loreyi]
MEKLLICRICLVENVHMYAVVSKHMQDVYQSLTDVPFVTEDSRPILACFFCYAKLKQCCRLQRQCREAEELFAQMMNEPNPSITRGQRKFFNRFVKTRVVDISVDGVGEMEHVVLKEELPEFCEDLEDIVEPKEEPLSDDLTLDDTNNGYANEEDIPQQQPESNLDKMEFEIDVEKELDLLAKKRCATDARWTSVAKKPKEDERRSNLEDAIEEEETKTIQSDAENTQTAQNTTREDTIEVQHKCDPSRIYYQESPGDLLSTSQLSYHGNQETETNFHWTTQRITHEMPDFNDSQSGIQLDPTKIRTELDMFLQFMDNDFVSMVVEMTNKYHSNFVTNAHLRTNSRLHKWDDVTVPEMYIFFSILILMTRNRHLTIEEHWSSDILLHAPVFSKLMSRNRFSMILSMLHFSDLNEAAKIRLF